MSKRKKSIAEAETTEALTPEPVPAKADKPKAAAKAEVNIVMVNMTLPCTSDSPAGYVTERIDFRMNGPQRATANRLLHAMRQEGCEVRNLQHGRLHRVECVNDVVRYLLAEAARVLDEGAQAKAA